LVHDFNHAAGDETKAKTVSPAYLYGLFAVVVHFGTLNTGHYVCFIRQSGSAGQWFRIDDEMVTLTDWEEVRKCQA
jgi:ubiquitin carboxyl-terminal hydrolase 22/27/51